MGIVPYNLTKELFSVPGVESDEIGIVLIIIRISQPIWLSFRQFHIVPTLCGFLRRGRCSHRSDIKDFIISHQKEREKAENAKRN